MTKNKINIGFAILFIAALVFASACGKSEKATDRKAEVEIETPAEQMPTDKESASGSVAGDAEQALREAALQGDINAVEDLIGKSTDVNSALADGRTALMLSSFNGNYEIIETLLNAGAAVDLKDISGRTALMYASTGPFPEAVKLLLEKGADPNIADLEEKFTPLMFAAAEGHLEVVDILLKNKANHLLMDKDGDTAERFARQNGHTGIAERLAGL